MMSAVAVGVSWGGVGGISSVKRSDSCCSRMGWGVSRCEEVRQQGWW